MSPDSLDRARDQFKRIRELTAEAEEHVRLGSCLDAVGRLEQLRASAWQAQRQAVELARQQGRTWAEIGQQVGISRQAAQQRFSADSRQP